MYNKWQTLSIPVWEQFGKCSWSPGSVLSKCLIFCKKAKPSLSDMSHSFDRKLLTNTHKLTLTFLQEFSQTFSLMICEFFAWYFRHISKNNWYYSFPLSCIFFICMCRSVVICLTDISPSSLQKSPFPSNWNFLFLYTLHEKWSFPLRISSVNVTKSAISDLVTFIEENLMENFNFCAVTLCDGHC